MGQSPHEALMFTSSRWILVVSFDPSWKICLNWRHQSLVDNHGSSLRFSRDFYTYSNHPEKIEKESLTKIVIHFCQAIFPSFWAQKRYEGHNLRQAQADEIAPVRLPQWLAHSLTRNRAQRIRATSPGGIASEGSLSAVPATSMDPSSPSVMAVRSAELLCLWKADVSRWLFGTGRTDF